MLNATSMAYHSNLSSYMDPMRSHQPTSTSDSLRTDYFVSSLDFEYNLFLKGLVSCDSSNTSLSTTNNRTRRNFYNTSYESPSRKEPSQQSSGRKHGSMWNSSIFTSIASLNSSRTNANSYQNLDRSSNYYNTVSNDYTSLPFSITNIKNIENNFSSQKNCYTSLWSSNKLNQNLEFSSTSDYYSCANFTPNLLRNSTSLNRNNVDNIDFLTKSPVKTCGNTDIPLVDNCLLVDQDDHLSHQHLHALHRFRGQKKKGLISRLKDVVISFTPKSRLSIIDRHDLYIRFGNQEKEAIACFDFLYEISLDYEDTSDLEEEVESNDFGLLSSSQLDLLNLSNCDTKSELVDDNSTDINLNKFNECGFPTDQNTINNQKTHTSDILNSVTNLKLHSPVRLIESRNVLENESEKWETGESLVETQTTPISSKPSMQASISKRFSSSKKKNRSKLRKKSKSKLEDVY